MIDTSLFEPPWLKIARLEIGVKESLNGETPRIVEYHQSVALKAVSDEISWCLNGDTEVLTSAGWIKFSALGLIKDSVEVVQVDPNTLKASLTKFLYIEKRYEGDVFSFNRRGMSFYCDPAHNFIGDWTGKGLSGDAPIFKKPIKNLTSTLCIPIVEDLIPDKELELSNKNIEFLAAYLADGNMKSKTTVQFNVSRDDKIERLKSFGEHKAYKRTKLYGKNKKFATNIVFKNCGWILDHLEDRKMLSWKTVFSMSKKQADIFIKTYQFFDGHHTNSGGLIINTTSAHVRDVMQALLFLHGHRTSYSTSDNYFDNIKTKDLFKISYSSNVKSLTLSKDQLRTESFSGSLYCISVPTGAFVARAGSMPFISGNCSSFINWCILRAGYAGTDSAAARSWLKWGKGLLYPAYGCVTVLKRTNNPALGHVGFFVGWNPEKVFLLGGNQNNSVSISKFDRTMIIGHRWM